MKTTQTIELSDDDVKEAVRLWLRKNVKPKDPDEWDVTLGTTSRGGDRGEPIDHVAHVTAKRLLP